jgi:hypothetical protein
MNHKDRKEQERIPSALFLIISAAGTMSPKRVPFSSLSRTAMTRVDTKSATFSMISSMMISLGRQAKE